MTVRVFVPMDSAAKSVGADEVAAAFVRLGKQTGKDLAVVRNGSRGMLWLEPLVEVETKDGRIFTGMVVYEAIDGVVIRNAANQTFRIEVADIESRKPLSSSLMPGGLLKDLKPCDYADLYAYLRTLTVQTAQAAGDHRATE